MIWLAESLLAAIKCAELHVCIHMQGVGMWPASRALQMIDALNCLLGVKLPMLVLVEDSLEDLLLDGRSTL